MTKLKTFPERRTNLVVCLPSYAPKVVIDLYTAIENQDKSLSKLTNLSGISDHLLFTWLTKPSKSIIHLSAIAKLLGFEVRLVKLEKSE